MSISIPVTREEFINHCLCRLGHPVIQIELAPEQQEIAVDAALSKYYDYHFDGNEEQYLICPITDTDVSNGYIPLEEKIHAVIQIIPINNESSMSSGSGIFSAQYQFYLNDFYNTNSIFGGNLSYIDSLKSYIATMNRTLVPINSFNFNRKTNRLYFNESLANIRAKASSLAIKVYKKIDADIFTDVWNDEFLRDYCTALMKKYWGSNLKKFSALTLPGGVTMNGEAIYTEAVTEIQELETKLINDLQPPLKFFMG